MSIVEKVKEWFAEGCDFDTGVELMNKVSTNFYFIRNIKIGRQQDVLEYELWKFLKENGVRVKKGKVAVLKRGGEVSERSPAFAGDDVKKGDKTSDRSPAYAGDKVKRGIDKTSGRSPAFAGDDKLIIRDEFPFLKRDDCPQELKILVADMITTHERYVNAHNKLFEVANKSNDVCFETANEVVENYLTNRQIWDELEYYKKTGKVLGKHPIFEESRKKTTESGMTREEIEKRIFNLNRQLKYRQNRLKKNRKNENVAERKKEMAEIRKVIKRLKGRIDN